MDRTDPNAEQDVSGSALGLRLGALPPAVVDVMFAGLVSEAEKVHGASVRTAIAASFASARVEAEIMEDPDVPPRERLKAASQFRDGFADACRLVSGASSRLSSPKRAAGASSTHCESPAVPDALDALYGESVQD
tara:strand:- start:222 stop:626 length:405 start_codon:yes stop_codon:yes gene_type:complete